MTVKFSEDVVPVSDIKINPSKVIRHATESHRPILLTSRGRGVAVMQSITDFERSEEEKMFMRAVVKGLSDLDNNRTQTIDQVKIRMGL